MIHKRNARGFTLVELLVSASISVIVGAAMSFAISKVGGQASGGSQITALSQELKPSVDLISDEIQPAARLYSAANLAAVSITGVTGAQPLVGFYVPDTTTAATNDYKFKMFYLADRPNTNNYNGPKVLYYYEDTANTTSTDITAQAAPTSIVGTTGRIVADNLVAQATTNCSGTTQNATNCINTFVADTVSDPNQKAGGMIYLKGTTTNMQGQQSNKTADQYLAVQTRVTVRN
jgi:prepilin-type N-terminal cleavage/methylation domain-containing protein